MPEPTVPRALDRDVQRRVQEGLPLVEMLARQLRMRLGSLADFDELCSIGHTALFEAARTYDPSRAKFRTYASYKIRWAMLDGLRRQRGGRGAAQRARAVVASERYAEGAAREAAEAPEPTDPDKLPDPEKQLQSYLAGQAAAMAVALVTFSTDAVERAADPGERVDDVLARDATAALLRRAIEELTDTERALIVRHYYEDERFDHIAADLGLSKSWASRIHARAVERLGKALSRMERRRPSPPA